MPAWFWEGLVIPLVVNEITGWSEWLARGLARWSARIRYANSPYARDMGEEWEAVILDRPVQLLKLLTATCFAIDAVRVWLCRTARQSMAGGMRIAAASYSTGALIVSTVTISAAALVFAAATLFSVLSAGTSNGGGPQGGTGVLQDTITPLTGYANAPGTLHLTGTIQHLHPGDHLLVFLQWVSIQIWWGGDPDIIVGRNGHWTGTICVGAPGNIVLWLVDLGHNGLATLDNHTVYWSNGLPFSPSRLAPDVRILDHISITARSGGQSCAANEPTYY